MAFGLLQFTLSLGGESDSVNAPIGLNQLLQQYGLPLNPHKRAMHRRMDAEPRLLVARPLSTPALEYAGGHGVPGWGHEGQWQVGQVVRRREEWGTHALPNA